MKIKLFILFLSIMLLIPSFANAAENVGTVANVTGKVNLLRQNETIPAQKGDIIFSTDIIETSGSSRARLKFNDASIITLGENSKLAIKEYLEGNGNKKGRAVFELLTGTLEATSGKGKFEIHTPNAVAGVRGTKFLVWYVNKETGLAVLLGEVDISAIGQPQYSRTVIQGYMSIMQRDGQTTEPVQTPEDLLIQLTQDTIICEACSRPEGGICVPDNTQDPGSCQKCENGAAVIDNSEDLGSCQKCENGAAVIDNSDDPGSCQKCENGAAVIDNSDDPGSCQKCENGAAVIDNSDD
ncbi:MAG: FecR family protein, partial [Thermodesulfovibrionia bacterium]|nr:FecR family protein [Thermodesulfovibrionia bacterium]